MQASGLPLLLFGFFLTLLPNAPQAEPKRIPAESAKPYAADQRFNVKVTIPAKAATVTFAVSVLAQRTDASLLVQDIGKPEEAEFAFSIPPYVELAAQDRPAREVMDALAEVLMSRWEKAGDVYVLVDYRDVALYLRLPQPERAERARKAEDALFSHLTPQERRALLAGKTLTAEDLSPAQQRRLHEVARYAWRQDPEHIWAPVWDLSGCALRLTPDRKAAGVYLAREEQEVEKPTFLAASRTFATSR